MWSNKKYTQSYFYTVWRGRIVFLNIVFSLDRKVLLCHNGNIRCGPVLNKNFRWCYLAKFFNTTKVSSKYTDVTLFQIYMVIFLHSSLWKVSSYKKKFGYNLNESIIILTIDQIKYKNLNKNKRKGVVAGTCLRRVRGNKSRCANKHANYRLLP